MNNSRIYNDYLGRLQTVTDISHIVKSCIDSNRSTVFSIEGEWGKGKTWLIERIANSLEGVDLTANQSQLKRQNTSNEYLVIRYNAWEKDYYEESLLAILITIINELNIHLMLENFIKAELFILYELMKDILESLLRSISKRLIGIDILDSTKRGIEIFKKSKKTARIKTESDFSASNIEKRYKYCR